MSDLDPETITGLLADGDRLRVVAALVLGAVTVDDVATATGLDVRAAGSALARLVGAGLVERDSHGYRVVEESIRDAARHAGTARAGASQDEGADDGGSLPRTMRPFVRDGRIVQLPTARTKRRQVLDLVSQDFEPGHRYREPEVNDMLSRWNDDVATLRRYLVDEGFLDRQGGGGTYWRAGGTVTV
ncbi:MAG: DUF2087 domain-containing protein [Acidimicrobiales bacterium]